MNSGDCHFNPGYPLGDLLPACAAALADRRVKTAARPTEHRSGGQIRAHKYFLILTMMVTCSPTH